MTITFRPAELSGVGLFIALAGGSRTGKSFTALTLARGIAGPAGRVAAIDTEGRRLSHYKNDFLGADGQPFDVFDMPSPFGGDRFVEAAQAAQDASYDALVIDSFSLEWSGTGGVLHQHAQLMAGETNQRKSDQMWNRVKGPGSTHKLMMDRFLQLTIPIIFCLRANPVADHLGGGWRVDQDRKFLYEWTVGLTLHPETPGMPRYDMFDAKKKPLWKVQEQHKHLFPEGKLITAEAGAALQAWRNTDLARKTTSVNREPEPPTPEEIADALSGRFEDVTTAEDLDAIGADEKARTQFQRLLKQRPELGARVDEAYARAKARVGAPQPGRVQDAAA